MTVNRDQAELRLRAGDRLVHDRQAGTWSLLRTCEAVAPRDALALLADRTLALAPAGDQLPGFPAACSQTWSCPQPRRRRRPAAKTAAAAATAAAGPP